MAAEYGSRRHRAVTASVAAAFLWASYYGFVIGLVGRISDLALLAYPFLFGGVLYSAAVVVRGEGRALLRLLGTLQQWGRAAVFFAVQVTVVIITLQAGSVDSALLSLAGDVAMTPLLVMLYFGEGRERLRSPSFWAGVALSSGGAALTILAGGAVVGLSGLALLSAPFEVILIAVFFVSTARLGRSEPVHAATAGSALLAGLFALPFAFVLPAATGSLAVPGPLAFVLLLATGATTFGIAPALYFFAIGEAGIFLPALLMAGIPVFTLGITAALTGALPPPLGLLGVPIAVFGAILAIRGPVGESPNPAPP